MLWPRSITLTLHNFVLLTENKTFAAIAAVLIGSGAFGYWLKRRDRRLALQDEALKFITETAALNGALSPLFGIVRRHASASVELVDERISALYDRRLSTRAKSEVFLASHEFWQEYERITKELSRMSTTNTLAEIRPSQAGVASSSAAQDLEPWQVAERQAQRLWDQTAFFISRALHSILYGSTFTAHIMSLRQNKKAGDV